MRVLSSHAASSSIPGSRSSQRSCVSAMSSALGAKTSKTKLPSGAEQLAGCAQRSELRVLGLHVQERPKRADDERDPLGHRRVDQVAEAEVDEGGDFGRLRGLACDGEHPRRRVDADHLDSRLRDRDGDAARAYGELDHRAARFERVVDVEADVLGHRPAPRVVDTSDGVVQGHDGFLATQTNSRLDSSNGRRSNQP